MPRTGLFIGKYGIMIDTSEKAIKFYDLGARGIITEVDSLYDNTIFWLGSIGYCIEDLAQGLDNIARLTSESFPDLAIKSRLNTYNQYACMYARHIDHNNWYGVYLYYGLATSDHVICKRVNGAITNLATEAVDLVAGYWYWVKFEVVGTTLNSYRAPNPTSDVPVTPTITATDADIATGRWGIRHWGLGLRGLHGLFLEFKRPTSKPPKPLKYYIVQVDGEGTPENPFQPRIPSDIKWVDEKIVHDPISYNRLKKLSGKRIRLTRVTKVRGETREEEMIVSLNDDLIDVMAEALGIISTGYHVNKLASTWSMLMPTKDGKPVDGAAILRIFDIPSRPDEFLSRLRSMGAQEIPRDKAIKMALKMDDRLHKADLISIRRNRDKEAKDYIEWRESQFRVHMNEELVKHYIKLYKGW